MLTDYCKIRTLCMDIQAEALKISTTKEDIKVNVRFYSEPLQFDVDILEEGIDNLSVTIDLTGKNALTRLTRVKELLDRIGEDKVES